MPNFYLRAAKFLLEAERKRKGLRAFAQSRLTAGLGIISQIRSCSPTLPSGCQHLIMQLCKPDPVMTPSFCAYYNRFTISVGSNPLPLHSQVGMINRLLG